LYAGLHTDGGFVIQMTEDGHMPPRNLLFAAMDPSNLKALENELVHIQLGLKDVLHKKPLGIVAGDKGKLRIDCCFAAMNDHQFSPPLRTRAAESSGPERLL
jgi:hypothetical protein